MAIVFLLSEAGAEHAETFLGLPLWIWQTANLVLFFGLLARFVGKPLAQAFRKRQDAVEERRREAERLKADAAKLTEEIRQRLSRLDGEIEAVRASGVAEGEAERQALIARADQEAERVKREAGEEIERRAGTALLGLERAASDLVAAAAVELLTREINDDDRRRLFEDSVERLRSLPR